VEEHGFRLNYSNKTGFLDIPPPWVLLDQAFTTGIEVSVLIKIIFPLLLGAGSILTGLLASHIMYVATGRTTLEHKIMLVILKETAVSQLQCGRNRSNSVRRPNNPFNEGVWRNMKRLLGPNLLLVFAPIPVKPPPPFVPQIPKKKNS
jgi:hypothetical protein